MTYVMHFRGDWLNRLYKSRVTCFSSIPAAGDGTWKAAVLIVTRGRRSDGRSTTGIVYASATPPSSRSAMKGTTLVAKVDHSV